MRYGMRWNKRRNEDLVAHRANRKSGILLFVLFFISIVLLISSRLEGETVAAARGLFADLTAPLFEAASLPAAIARRGFDRANSYLVLFEELDRLKIENHTLQQAAWRAKDLERRLAQMAALLNAVDEPALGFASGRVIADARGPFARSMLLNIGTGQGVKAGFAVINADGLVGRIVNTGTRASRLILLSDLNSKIPVQIGPSATRAVLVGDNSSAMVLQLPPAGAQIYPGDEVYTSGHGGLFPHGLRIGTVASETAKGFRVTPHAKFDKLEYVSVLFFNAPVIAAKEADELALRRAPRAMPQLAVSKKLVGKSVHVTIRESSRTR